MASTRPAPISVHLLPSLIPPGALRGGVAVVVDVLRATTAMIHALASGCEAIIPCLEVDEARAVAGRFPLGAALLGGERRGLPIEGFDLGNSPASYSPERCRGKTLVMTTTNGTKAILSSLDADLILIGAFVNASRLLISLGAETRPVHVVCAGTDGEVSLEDTVFAGTVVTFLDLVMHRPIGNDSALLAKMAVNYSPDDIDDLAARISGGRGGRRVRELGLEADIQDAARADRFPILAEVVRDPVRIVRV